MKVGIVLCTYERPEYLKQCLESLKSQKLYDDIDTKVLIVDDGSQDMETINLIESSKYEAIYVPMRRGIRNSLMIGYNYFFEKGFEMVMNIDSDALLCDIAISEIVRLKQKYEKNIVSGFHTMSTNRFGEIRHQILNILEDAYLKKSVGGINFCINKYEYESYVFPCLKMKRGNWDTMACGISMMEHRPIITPKESLIEHLGMVSTLGHDIREKPDVATGFVRYRMENKQLSEN